MTQPLVEALLASLARRILYEDEDVVVVDKPFGLATHAPDEGRKDDVVSWLTAHYEALGQSTYLGIHQRLDRDTSGVLLFARRKSANPSLAKQFEGRLVHKVYVAIASGRTPARAELHHYLSLAPGEDIRRARPASGHPRRGEQEAVTDLETLKRSGLPGPNARDSSPRSFPVAGQRALVQLSPRTGRTHQLRAQLAAMGAPILGDAPYGGTPDARLMLHARSLTIKHPSSAQPITFEAPVPHSFERALKAGAIQRPEGSAELHALIVEAQERRYGIVARGDTDALRIVNGIADGIPGVTVDQYGAHAVLSLYDELSAKEIEELAAALIATGSSSVYVKHRPKHASRVGDTRTAAIAPAEPIAGEAAPTSFEIREHGVPYEVHLGDGLSTGIFLDQRDNRARVAALAKGKTVLNLFGYTGAFSVAAAVAGARSTTTVDVSRTVLDWARRNLTRVGATLEDHPCIEAEVFTFLRTAKKNGRRWDIVIVDPPSFSTTKDSTFSAETDLEELATAALWVVEPGGQMLVCTNHRGIRDGMLRKALHGAARAVGVEVPKMKSLPAPTDFPPPPGEEPHLKTVLVTRK